MTFEQIINDFKQNFHVEYSDFPAFSCTLYTLGTHKRIAVIETWNYAQSDPNSLNKEEDSVHIEKLYVDPLHRKQGIATQLISLLFSYVEIQCFNHVTVNPVAPDYEKNRNGLSQKELESFYKKKTYRTLHSNTNIEIMFRSLID